jgi:hypothetical protein
LSNNKRFDSNYQNISGYVPKELAVKFRQHITGKGLKINEGLEEMIRGYLTTEGVELPPASEDKG